MMKRIILALIILAVLAGGGFYLWKSGMLGGHGAAAGAGGGAMMGMGGPQSVATITIAPQTITVRHELPGRVTAYRQSQVRPQVDGIVTERLFEEGASVEKGQQLYQIDAARYKAALNSALADLKSAQASLKTVKARAGRYEELIKINAISQQEYDDVKAELDQANAAIAVAQAAVDLAQVNLGYTKVYAPIAGRIGKSFVTEGALVTANQAQYLSVITQLDPVYIDMQQSGLEANQLRRQLSGKAEVPVHVILDETVNEVYPREGRLKFSEVTIDETAGSIALRALMPNPKAELLPGLFVRATLDLGEDKVLLVPQRAAIRTPDGSLMVWVVDGENKAQMRPITVDRAQGEDWIVLSGLQEGDQVIVSGYLRLGPGAPVVPTPWQAAAPEQPAGKAPAPAGGQAAEDKAS